MSNPNQILNRFLYPCDNDKEIILDENGLLLVNEEFRKYSNIIDLSEFSQLPGAILIAEGGMGKTTFMKQLENTFSIGQTHLIELGTFSNDQSGLRDNINSFILTIKAELKPALLIDGFDEAPDLWGMILRLRETVPKCVSVWVASRYVEAICVFQSKFTELKLFNLAPLSEQDIRKLVSNKSLDEDDFLKAARKQGIISICSKPLGCELAINEFNINGLSGISQRDLWKRGIERLCDETPSDTRHLLPPSPFNLKQIVECSAWIALCSTLSGRAFIWVGGSSYCPKQSVDMSSLALDEFSLDLVRKTLERGIFTPLGDGRIRFTHAVYRDYLSAFGFTKFILPEHWSHLLFSNDRKQILPQRAGLAAWLTSFNSGFCDELSTIQPELLLSSADAIQAIEPSGLCIALLNRADSISFQQRHNTTIAENLFRLKSTATSQVIKDCLLIDTASESKIEFAIEIAEACKFSELSNIFANRVLDETLSLQQRVDASYAVYRLADNEAQGRLKALLPINPKSDPQDDLRGNILRCCWPNHLTPDELLTHLISPQKPNYLGPYGAFLDHNLPESFQSNINETNADIFLKWCIPHFVHDLPYDSLGRLARLIYSYCWHWALNQSISTLLAKGYLQAEKNYSSPFFNDVFLNKQKAGFAITKETFEMDTPRRLAVLEALMQSEKDEKVLSKIPFNRIPLFSPRDAKEIIGKILTSPSGILVNKWGICLKAIINRRELIQYAEEIDRVHIILPDIIDPSKKIMLDFEEVLKRSTAYEQKIKKERDRNELKQQINQTKVDNSIKALLQKTDLEPNQFVNIASWLFSNNGHQQFGSIDLTQSLGWGKLSPANQEAFLKLSEKYLLEGNIKSTNAGNLILEVAQALHLLRIMKPDRFDNLTKEFWGKCSVELLKTAYNNYMGQLGPLFDTLSDKFPEIAEKALINVIKQELTQDHITIIHHWGARLTKAQAASILQISNDSSTSTKHNYLVLYNLARQGQTEMVVRYLDNQIKDDWKLLSNQGLDEHLLLAFSLCPNKFGNKILDTIKKNREWGRVWIEIAVMNQERTLNKAIISCISEIIADFYIWLHTEYPESTRIEHHHAYSPGSLDNIHELKRNIINYLVQSGIESSLTALKKIQISFPNDSWLQDCIIDARENELANEAPTLSMLEIKLLKDNKNASRRIVKSILDLHILVSEQLKKYQIYLQGDIPAIGDLWNSLYPDIRPKEEECLSDHLKRYLELTIKSDVVLNREVQIKRKHYKNGLTGSKTDIWIQAIDHCGKTLTLCIEVKCNWNPEAKKALKNQLVTKYMSGGTAKAGILLLGWFACKDWDNKDNRKSESIKIWTDIESARSDLEFQAEQEHKADNIVSTIVIDCSLE